MSVRGWLRSPVIWTGLLISALFWVLWPFLPVKLTFDMLNAVVVSVGIGVVVAYAPGIFVALRRDRRELTSGKILIIGIIATWVATNVRSAWNWAWRYYHKPPEMIDHPVVAFMLLILIMGGVLHLTARDAIDGQVPRQVWRRVGIIIAIGLSAGGLFFAALEQ
jgi:hypothetical protein